ncbi:autophagy-related protein 23, putative (ATG23) [Plasmodium ovale curtisi]|uniref:Autophagy-related protein 23, putative (ATG23) n=1 Tax=Plasmodium ovale curtisi TaxID=864141 RepID=A0A1A8XG97_PLAOA|nr:autophagy-related protein 23, putative (ATG23) [Plasmodium ovale curtisi]
MSKKRKKLNVDGKMIKGVHDLQIKSSPSSELLLEIKKMENELQKRNEEYEELNNSCREIYGRYIRTKTDLDEASNNYQEHIFELETVIKEKENEYMDLRINFEQLLEEKYKLEGEIANYEKAIYEINENYASQKEAHKEELKEIQEEISTLYEQIDSYKKQLDITKEEHVQLQRLNEVTRNQPDHEKDKDNIIDSLRKEFRELQDEKKVLGLEVDVIKTQQNKIKAEIEKLDREREKLKKGEEKIFKEKLDIEKCKEEIEKEKRELLRKKEEVQKEKELIEGSKYEVEKHKKQIQRNKEEVEKEKERQENNIKNIIIKYSNLQKERDNLAAENSNKDICIREVEDKVNTLENENKMFKNKILCLDRQLQEVESELASQKKGSIQLKEDVDTKKSEVLKRDSIIQILYDKLKEKESELVLFQNENLSLKKNKKELSKILENRKSEMDNIEKASQIDNEKKNTRKGRLALRRTSGIWFGYVDICKNVLKTRDAYLYSGNKNHRFISAYDTDLFLDVQQDGAKKCLLSYRNETRGIFLIGEEEVKSLTYIGPFSKYHGYNVSFCHKTNSLQIVKERKGSYIFEEMYETKNGTKLVLIREMESGKYFSGLRNNTHCEKKTKQKGVDKLNYNNVVNKLINYITNEIEENGNMVIRKSEQKVKIECDNEEKKKHAEGGKEMCEKETSLVKKRENNVDFEQNYQQVCKNVMEKIHKTTQLQTRILTKKENRELCKNEKTKNTKLSTSKGNIKDQKKQDMDEESLHKYNIAKEMLLLPDSNCNSTTDHDNDHDSNGNYGKSKYDAVVGGVDGKGEEAGNKEEAGDWYRDDNQDGDENGDENGDEHGGGEDEHLNTYQNGALTKPMTTNYIRAARISLYNCCNDGSSDCNNTNIILTEKREEANLFEIFTYEQIVERDAIKFASEWVLHFILNSKKGNSQDVSPSTICSNHNSNLFSSLDGDCHTRGVRTQEKALPNTDGQE